MDLVRREIPFGAPARGSKRTLYRIADPFLRFWFRFVEPNRSRLVARRFEEIQREIAPSLAHHVASVWEDLARDSVQRLDLHATQWGPASRWWGAGLDGGPLEVDVVAESVDGRRVLVGEVKWAAPKEVRALVEQLRGKAERLPFIQGREVIPVVWVAEAPRNPGAVTAVTPKQVLEALR